MQLWRFRIDVQQCLQFYLRSANFDFEMSDMNAFFATYACRFCFGQTLRRNIQRLDLTVTDGNISEVSHFAAVEATIYSPVSETFAAECNSFTLSIGT